MIKSAILESKKAACPQEKEEFILESSPNSSELEPWNTQRFYSDAIPLSPGRVTKKEMFIIIELAKGNNSKSISTLMNCTPRTIESHIERIKNKLGVVNRKGIIDFLFKEGIIRLHSPF